MTPSDLRAELGARAVPEFEMTLPPGWTRKAVDETALDEMLGALRTRLMEAHRPEAYVELQPLLRQSFKAMQREGAFAFFTATEPDESTVWLPASIIASERRAEAGETLDDLAVQLIREHGATPLAGDKRTLRFERERPARLGSQTVINHSIIYLTPIPGTGRRKALQLVAGFGRAPEDAADDPFVMKTKYLFDSCVATLRWKAPRGL